MTGVVVSLTAGQDRTERKLTVGKGRHVNFLDTPPHGLLVWQGLHKYRIDANSLEFLGPGEGFLPAVDESVSARKDKYILAFVSRIACGLDSGKCLSPGHDRLSLGVATS